MHDDNIAVGRQLFKLITGKVTLLRIEIELLEIEGNGLRRVAEELVRKLSATPAFTDPGLVEDSNTIINQKWAEQAQRYTMEANTIAKILLDKSKQMLELVEFLKGKLRELGFDVPDDGVDLFGWDEFLFESGEVSFD